MPAGSAKKLLIVEYEPGVVELITRAFNRAHVVNVITAPEGPSG